MAILRQLIESTRAITVFRILCNFEQTLACHYRHDICEQTSGEDCSANVPIRKSLGRFVIGKNLQSGLTRRPYSRAIRAAFIGRHHLKSGDHTPIVALVIVVELSNRIPRWYALDTPFFWHDALVACYNEWLRVVGHGATPAVFIYPATNISKNDEDRH